MCRRAKRDATRIGALLVALAMPAATAAQSDQPSPIDEVRQESRLHVGPLYAQPTLQLKEFGIDNNVFNTYGDQQQSDFTFTLFPKADLSLPVGKRALFQATTAADLVWYQKYAGERSIDPRLDVRGRVFVGRITLFGERDYVNTRQRPNQEIDVRARHREEALTAGADVAVTPEISVLVAGHQFTTRYDAAAEYDNTSLQRTLNRVTDALEVKTRYRLTPLTSIAVRYDRLRDRFLLSPGRDSDSFRVMPGVEFRPEALISGSAYVGYREFTPSDPAVLPSFKGLVAELGLSYTLLGATTFAVSSSRDLTYSYDELQPFFVDDSVGVSVRRALGRRFDALVSADRHAYAYRDLLEPDPALAAGDPAIPGGRQRIDVTWNYTASVGYRVGREGRVAFGASYWNRESTTVLFRNYNNLRFGSTMTLGF
ncbi:MAG: outer membrane beta-barrel protein [Betaproteobacteria bacterium]